MRHHVIKTVRFVFILYIGALLLSWGIQFFFPTSDKPNLYQDEKIITVGEKQIEYTYLDLPQPKSNKTIFLIPDLFGGPEFLLPLGLSLQDSVNVIIPSYPQNSKEGQSLRFTIHNRANYLNVLIDSLKVDDAHILGHGYGGLIAIELASDSSLNKYKSLTLLSSYGPQELQFLGNHIINKTLYSMLYPIVGIFKYAVPHMGWYYEQPVNFDFINTLTAIDQRPVRNQLAQIQQPVHIIQPIDDRYVSLAIAKEIYRLVPHSTLFVVKGDHAITKEKPSVIAPHIIEFLKRTDQNFALHKEEANSERIENSRKPFDAENFETVGGWTLVIILLLIFIIAIISEDLSCIAGGLLVASGIIDFWFAVLGACLGVLIPDVIIYSLGRYIGNPILQWIPFRWFIKKEDIEKAEQMYRMRGVEIIFATRFLPGTRLPVYLVSGMIHVKFSFFLFYFILAMLIWAPLLVWLSALIGQPMISYLASYQDHAIWIVPVIIITVYLITKGIILISTVTGRRKVVVKFERFKEKYFRR